MNNQQFLRWCQQSADASLQQVKPLIMGIINVTPDSFSDGGSCYRVDDAFKQAMHLINQGADLLDIGGESSRPGAKPISVDEEVSRVLPLIERLKVETDICLSVDTCKAAVMKEVIAAGAGMINVIQALNAPTSLAAAVNLQVPVCLMHMQGKPETMQDRPYYQDDIIAEINSFFEVRIEACVAAGLPREMMILDPGFGFGKTVAHNLKIVKQLQQFKRHNLPLLLGVSRKSTIGAILNKPIHERLTGSIALTVMAIQNGLNIIRTHDVVETRQAVIMTTAIMQVDNEE